MKLSERAVFFVVPFVFNRKEIPRVVMDACPFYIYTSQRMFSLQGRWKTHVIPD